MSFCHVAFDLKDPVAEQSKKIILSYHFHSFLHVWDHCDFFPFTKERIQRGGRAVQYRFAIKTYTLCKNLQVSCCLGQRANFFGTTR